VDSVKVEPMAPEPLPMPTRAPLTLATWLLAAQAAYVVGPGSVLVIVVVPVMKLVGVTVCWTMEVTTEVRKIVVSAMMGLMVDVMTDTVATDTVARGVGAVIVETFAAVLVTVLVR